MHNNGSRETACCLMPLGVSKYRFCVLRPVWGTSCSHDHSKCSVALMADLLIIARVCNILVKLDMSCTMCMRIHPPVRPPPSLAWTSMHHVHTRRVRRCGWLSGVLGCRAAVLSGLILKRSL
jgi:hypothetical protein